MILRTTISILLLLVVCTVNGQDGSCRTSEAMRDYFEKNPSDYKEFLEFNNYSKGFSRSNFAKSNSGQITIPVVFHVYGRTQNGATVTDEKIINSLQMVNEDFQGLNPDFYTVDPLFVSRRSKTNIVFKLAKIDPNGNPTTGIIEHPVSAGQGNYNSPIVAADAWDNYKYMNVYITADLYDDGKSTHSGVAWYPNKSHSDDNRARVTYNGRYLKGNTDDEFASILTHEFGHWLNLLHTFEGGCASFNQDYVDDTPQEDKSSADDSCLVGATDCGDSLINYENYMGYDSSSGCAKMFTKGQTDRMYAALNHPARLPLWQNDNLIATGLGGSLSVTPRVFDGTSWKESTAYLEVCPGTNVKIGMQNVGTSNVEIIKPNGLVDNTPDGATHWNINNAQESDSGTYLIRYKDGNGGIGFGIVTLNVGYTVRPWIQYDNTSTDWFNLSQIKACPGSNISIGMQANAPGTKSLRLPNGNLSTIADDNGVWKFNNIANGDAGVYTILYDMGGCTYSTAIEVILESNITPWVALDNDWKQQAFIEACVGDKVHLGMTNVGTSNVTITGPNGFFDDTPDLGTGFEFTSITAQNYGTYTITYNDPASCSGSVEIELRPKNEGLEGWVRDNAENWSKKGTLFACVGDNIALGTRNLGTTNFKITAPDGTVDTTPDISTGWFFNNIQKSDEGVYKIEYNNGNCYSSTNVVLKVGVADLSNSIEYQVNNSNFATATNNTVTINEGDKVGLRIPGDLFEGTISWTGPNDFASNYKAVEITDSASESVHAGIYTATVTHANSCGSSNSQEIINFEIKFEGGTDPTCTDGIQNGDETGVDCGGSSCTPCTIAVDGGTVSTSDNKTEITTITGDGIADVITFNKVNQSEANYAYLITDEVGKILATETTSHDFEGAAAGICKVYGISYNGNLTVTGKNITDTGLASENFDVSGNFITITREQHVPDPTCDDGIQNGDETGIDCGGSSCTPCQTDVTYCDMSGNNTADDSIANVNFAGINNTSSNSASGYENFTNVSGNVVQGASEHMTVTIVGYRGGANNEVYAWFDWNMDGDFTDVGEKFEITTQTSGTIRELTINIPETAKIGTTRMRIVVGYNAGDGNSACGTISYGEVEDYSISVTGGTGPTCTDGIQNGDETGIDCGGSSCEPCAVEPTCTDGIQNGDETGVDCGGSSCAPCNTNSGVVYVDIDDITVSSSSTWNFFRIQVGDNNDFGSWYSSNSVRLVAWNKQLVCEGATSNVTLIGENTGIDGSNNFVTNSHSYVVSASSYTDWNGKTGFVGFNFKIDGQTHYGWFHITVANDGLSFTILDYAYNTNPNTIIYTTTNSGSSGPSGKDSSTKSANNITIAPNPFNNNTQINVAKLKGETFSISIYNMLGQRVFEKTYTNNPNSVSIGNEITESGTYFVKVRSASTNKVIPIVKK